MTRRGTALVVACGGGASGGLIMVQGLPPYASFLGRFHRALDWTNGCIALSNPEMAQVFAAVPDGTPIELLP